MPVVTERRVHRRPLPHFPAHPPGTTLRALGTGVITGAADDDPSAIGTYASAGAAFGPSILWAAPVLFPLSAAILYLAAKLGQVAGQGFGAILKQHYPRWVLVTVVIAIVGGNTMEAAADLGGIGAALHLLTPWPQLVWVVPLAAGILAVQVFGSYTWLRSVFRWLALALLAYIGAALLARPDFVAIFKSTLVPNFHWTRNSVAALVAMIGAAGSPYLYSWQVSQRVEEDISRGRRRLSDRRGTTAMELKAMAWDVILGMFFATVVMYFILLATAITIYPTSWGQIQTAAQAAQALAPLAGNAAGALFAAGVIAVGFLAVPVITVGAAYILCDMVGWKSGLSARRQDAPQFYWIIAAILAAAAGINFLGLNPMHALVVAGLVQGFLAPGMIVLLLLMTNNAAIVGKWKNSLGVNVLGSATALASTAAAVTLLVLLR